MTIKRNRIPTAATTFNANATVADFMARTAICRPQMEVLAMLIAKRQEMAAL